MGQLFNTLKPEHFKMAAIQISPKFVRKCLTDNKSALV